MVVNSAGSTNSPMVEIQTLEALPEGLSPPATRVNPEELYIVYLAWEPPRFPNGKLIVIFPNC